MDFRDRITIEVGKRGGRPCIRGPTGSGLGGRGAAEKRKDSFRRARLQEPSPLPYHRRGKGLLQHGAPSVYPVLQLPTLRRPEGCGSPYTAISAHSTTTLVLSLNPRGASLPGKASGGGVGMLLKLKAR
jgi:hypothetical protein